MKKAVIFGGGGQDGFYLTELLRSRNYHVICTARGRQNIINCDVSDFVSVHSLLTTHQPSFIYNFAAKSTTSHEAVFANQKAIVDGTLNILESARIVCPHARIFITGSALQFENNGQGIHEEFPLVNSSIYATQRNCSLQLARLYRKEFGLLVYFGYLFHHDSPFRSDNHIASKIINYGVAIKKNKIGSIELLNPLFEKEWTFSGDTMEAVQMLMEQETIFEAVIGSGNPFSIKDWGVLCFDMLGLQFEKHLNYSNQNNWRHERIFCQPRLIYSLGWSPKVGFRELAQLMLKKSLNDVCNSCLL